MLTKSEFFELLKERCISVFSNGHLFTFFKGVSCTRSISIYIGELDIVFTKSIDSDVYLYDLYVLAVKNSSFLDVQLQEK